MLLSPLGQLLSMCISTRIDTNSTRLVRSGARRGRNSDATYRSLLFSPIWPIWDDVAHAKAPFRSVRLS